MATPLSTVKKRFESKAKLIEAVREFMTDELWLPRLSNDRGGNKDLRQVSNKKLLHLHAVLSDVQKQFETRGKLVEAVLEIEGRAKDESYKARLDGYPVPRLYDLYRAVKRRNKSASARSAKA